ncbi:MAG: sugar transferase [Candidatus Omnitrophica bacterium]|nr:sugar transferase [Candidatus Omnitrophota bacterium]
MLHRQNRGIRQGMMFLDVLIVVISFFVAFYIRLNIHNFYSIDLFPAEKVIASLAPISLNQYLLTLLFWIPLWLFSLHYAGAYNSLRTNSFLSIIRIIVIASFVSSLGFFSISFILKIQYVSRLFVLFFLAITASLLIIEKCSFVYCLHQIRRHGRNLKHVLIVGTGPRAERFVRHIRDHSEWGFHIMGLVDDEAARVGKKYFDVPVIGVLDDIPDILRNHIVDEVVFVVPRRWLDKIQKSISACELQGIHTNIAADLFDSDIAQRRHVDLDGFPLITFETTVLREWQAFVKRIVDIFISAIGLLILSPFYVLIAIIIKTNSPGPVFFKQKRQGLNGRIFTLYKFRTMDSDAEERLEELRDLDEIRDGVAFKLKNDPRITRMGDIMRKTSIDELPQLYNVLMGHMSVVGPRPLIFAESWKYKLWQRRRLSMRPGLTCLWQISGRSNVGFEEWMRMDLQYIDNWSLWLDFIILVKTIPVILLCKGAR